MRPASGIREKAMKIAVQFIDKTLKFYINLSFEAPINRSSFIEPNLT